MPFRLPTLPLETVHTAHPPRVAWKPSADTAGKAELPWAWRNITPVASVVTGLVGGLVLSGWVGNVSFLKSVLPHFASMKFNTAVCFILSAIGLWCLREELGGVVKHRLGLACAGIVTLIALLSFGQIVFGWNLRIDELLFHQPGGKTPGRMSLASAVCFFCVGLALLILETNWRGRLIVSQALALLVTLLALIGLEGYLLGCQETAQFFAFKEMAVHAAGLFLVLGSGVLWLRRDQGFIAIIASPRIGGIAVRNLIFWIVWLPIIAAFLTVNGQQAGYFSAEFGVALFATFTVVLGGALGWNMARTVNRLHGDLEQKDLVQAQLAAIVNSSADAIMSTALDGKVSSWNHGAEKLFGYTAGEMVSQPINRIIPDDSQEENQRMLARILRWEQVTQWECQRLHRDGRRVEVSVTVSPVLDLQGRITGAATIAHDITNGKKTEKELIRSNSDLEQFAYVASHDLQEPLRAVGGCLQVLQRRYAGQLDAMADELIGHSVEGVIRLQTLIEGLLTFSRVGRRQKELQPASLDQELDLALQNLVTTITDCGAVITRTPLPIVKIDPTQLTLVFQNLIGNALKFRGADVPRIAISVKAEGADWKFTVHDNGIGVAPEYFQRIFVIFQRLHTRKEYAGTGLGLAICQKIVERHGGRIWIESAPGQGTAFHFTLPRLDRAPESAEFTPPQPVST